MHPAPHNTILIVDDEVGIRELLSEILQDEGYSVSTAENAAAARAARTAARPDLVLLDIWMPDTDGITLLKEWAGAGLLTMPVVVMSGHGSIDTAVEATRIGAFDFLEKPIPLQKLLSTVKRALKPVAVKLGAPPARLTLSNLGKSAVIADLKRRLTQIAHLSTPVLLTGEPGAGVELCARFLQQPNTPWLTLELPAALALPAEELEPLLASAQDGTVFMGDVSALKRQQQRNLLPLLARFDAYRLRCVCHATKSLAGLVASGDYEADVFIALSGVSLPIPPLRAHREDIPDLANFFLMQAVEAGDAPPRHFSTAALNALRNHDWPGNLLQLGGVVQSLALTALADEISLDDVLPMLPAATSPATRTVNTDSPLREARDEFERAYFERLIVQENGNMVKLAERAGLERTHLYRKLKQLGISLPKKM